jgi:phosphonate transport system substrate-binding protein
VRLSSHGLGLGLVLSLVGCGGWPDTATSAATAAAAPSYGTAPADPRGRAYRLAVHPLYNPGKLQKAYQPLIDHLHRELPGLRFQLEASRDYAAYERKLQADGPELLLPNPWQTLKALKAGYSVIAMAGDPDDFRGLILVRRDGGVQRPGDLVGRQVSCPSPTALAACIMPQYYLQQQGVLVGRDFSSLYVGSQESSILSVYHRRAAAAATWPPPWRAFQLEHPIEAAELKVMWQTAPLLNNSVMVRGDVPTEVRSGLRRVLMGLNDSASGRGVLSAMQTARFFDADDQRYEQVRDYVARFERDVRSVESRP